MAKLTQHCSECKGTGTVPVIGFRDNSRQEDEQSLPRPLLRSRVKNAIEVSVFWQTWCKIIRICGIVLSIIVGIGSITWVLNKGAQYDRRNRHADIISGKVLVEYDPTTGTPVKCIVEKNDTYTTNMPTRSLYVKDRFNLNKDELRRVFNWEETPEHKCYVFHYQVDDE